MRSCRPRRLAQVPEGVERQVDEDGAGEHGQQIHGKTNPLEGDAEQHVHEEEQEHQAGNTQGSCTPIYQGSQLGALQRLTHLAVANP